MVPIVHSYLAPTASGLSRAINQLPWHRSNSLKAFELDGLRTHVDLMVVTRALETEGQVAWHDGASARPTLYEDIVQLLPLDQVVQAPDLHTHQACLSVDDAYGFCAEMVGTNPGTLKKAYRLMSSGGMFRSSPVRLNRNYSQGDSCDTPRNEKILSIQLQKRA